MLFPVISFEEGSSTLDSVAIRELERLVDIMELSYSYTLEIGGSCDTNECVNGDTLLSYQRAHEVRKKLLELNPDFCELKVFAFGAKYPERVVRFRLKEFPIIENGMLHYADSLAISPSIDSLIAVFEFVEDQNSGDKKKIVILEISNMFPSIEGRILYQDFILVDPMIIRKDDVRKSDFFNDSIYDANVSTLEVAKKIERTRLASIRNIVERFERDVEIVIKSRPSKEYNGIKFQIYETNCIIQQ